MPTTAVVIGKFMPLHEGHVYLIEFAKNFVDELTVLVDNLPEHIDTMTLNERVNIVTTRFPDVIVKGIDEVTFQEPEESPVFWEAWRDYIVRNVGYKPDYIIGSMDYIKKLAEVIGCEFIMVDKERTIYPISATIIRNSINQYLDGNQKDFLNVKKFVPDVTNDYLTKDIFIVGGESTGKSTLAKKLADVYQTINIPEYAIDYIAEKGTDIKRNDMYNIVRGQLALQNTVRKESNIFCFHDTDAISSKIWYRKFFGNDGIEFFDTLIDKQKDGFYILLSPSIPWVDETYRYFEDDKDRKWFHEEFKKELTLYGKKFIELNADEAFIYFKNNAQQIYKD